MKVPMAFKVLIAVYLGLDLWDAITGGRHRKTFQFLRLGCWIVFFALALAWR